MQSLVAGVKIEEIRVIFSFVVHIEILRASAETLLKPAKHRGG